MLRPWMRIALLIAALAALGAGGYALITFDEMPRPAPNVDPRLFLNGTRLRSPQNVSPTEEHPGPDGETLYLTYEQFRVANAAKGLPIDGLDRKLAAALVEEDPDVRAERLVALVESVPTTEDGDATALGLYALTYGAMTAPPKTAARDAAQKRLHDQIGCRFRPGSRTPIPLPKCDSAPTMIPVYALAGVAAIPLLAVLVGLVIGRRRNARERKPGAVPPVSDATA